MEPPSRQPSEPEDLGWSVGRSPSSASSSKPKAGQTNHSAPHDDLASRHVRPETVQVAPADTAPVTENRIVGNSAIEIIVADPSWHRLVPRAGAIARRAGRAAGLTGTIVLGSDRMVRQLNARHRGRNKPTNVLTYEQPAPEIILACGVVRAEAAAQHRHPAHHMAHLVVHGALHLSGEDHHHAGEARRMEMAESRILHRIGVPNPWKRA